MPRIPVSEKAGPVRYESNAVYMRGAPDANFGMESARSLARLGESIRQSGMQAGQAGLQISSAMKEYQRRSQEVTDQLMATEAQNLFMEEQGRVNTMMAENPNQYDQFKIWAAEADTQYAAQVGQYTEKMSPEFRAQFEAKMRGMRALETAKRERIGIQAHVTAQQNLFLSQWKRAAEANRIDECFEMLKKRKGNLISEEKYLQLHEETLHYADFGDVKRAIDAGQYDVIDALKERDAVGNYKNFKRLTLNEREKFIRVAEAKDLEFRRDENDRLIDRLNSGEQISVEDIETAFSGRTTPADIRQKNDQKRIVGTFNERREGIKRKNTEQRKKQEINAYEYNIMTYEFDPNPAVRSAQYSKMVIDLQKKYAGDGATYGRLKSQLDETYKSQEKEGVSYKKTPMYQTGLELIDFYESQGKLYADREWSLKDDKSKETVSTIKKSLRLDMDRFLKENPKANYEELEKFLNTKLGQYQEKTVENIATMQFNTFRGQQIQHQIQSRKDVSGHYEGQTGRLKDGRKVIWRNGKWVLVE